MLTNLNKTEMLAVCLATLVSIVWLIKTTPIETVSKDGEWHYSFAKDPVSVDDGAVTTGTVMTRWDGGTYEHRTLSRDEVRALDTAPVLGPSAQ